LGIFAQLARHKLKHISGQGLRNLKKPERHSSDVENPIGDKHGSALVGESSALAIVNTVVRKPALGQPSQRSFRFLLVVAKLKSENRAVVRVPHNQVFVLGVKPPSRSTTRDLSDARVLGKHVPQNPTLKG